MKQSKLIIFFLLLMRKACGLRILRGQMLRQENSLQLAVQQTADSFKSLNEANQNSIKEIQKQLNDLSSRINVVLDNSFVSGKTLEKRLQEIRSEFQTTLTDYSQKIDSIAQFLEANSSKKDISALSEQISRTEEAMNNVMQDIQSIDKTQSLILINQIMELSEDTIISLNAKKQ